VMNIFYAGAVLFVLSLSDWSHAPGKTDALKSEVIKAHDRIMPRNAELLEAEAGLSHLLISLDSLKELKPETDTVALRRRVDSLIHNLNAADNAMSEWMYAFDVDYTGMEEQAIIDYLNAEKTKITAIEQAYDDNIGAARDLMDSIANE